MEEKEQHILKIGWLVYYLVRVPDMPHLPPRSSYYSRSVKILPITHKAFIIYGLSLNPSWTIAAILQGNNTSNGAEVFYGC